MESKPEPISKEEKKTTYMREYKRRKYAENKDKFVAKNKSYYIKYKYKMSDEDMKKYNSLLPAVYHLRQSLNEIELNNPELIKELIAPYID